MKNSIHNAKWIATPKDIDCPVIVREFDIKSVCNTTLNITALGFFKVYINGDPVCDDRFLPLITNYHSRDTALFTYPIFDTLSYRLYYHSYDIDNLLKIGENTLEIHLANGWYRQTVRKAEGDVSFGDRLSALYSIDLCDGTHILSDGSESCVIRSRQKSDIFSGEVIDKTACDTNDYGVTVTDAPDTVLCRAQGVADRVIREISPTLIAKKDGKSIFDAGENTSGVVNVKTHAAYGKKIILRFAENIDENYELSFKSAGGNSQIQTDTFVCDGNDTVFEPEFIWHAFRYFEIEGEFDRVTVKVIHSDVKVSSGFASDCEGMDFLYDAFIRTQLCNMHCGIPTDCPHRERLGYTGDGQVCSQAGMLTLDSKEFYKKWITDILDSQFKVSGHSQHTAPFMGGGVGPGGWGSAIVFVPYNYYRAFGDTEMLNMCYPFMKKWVEYLEVHSENGLVVREEKDGWCLGDWASLKPMQIPECYVNTCFFIKVLGIMQKVAVLLDKNCDLDIYRKLEENAKAAVLASYGDIGHAQGASAFMVWCSVKDRSHIPDIASYYDALGCFDTGIFATDILMELFFKNGYEDTAYKLLSSEDVGSFLYMKRQGASTVWELWDGKASHNHPMFAACARQLFTSVLGIGQSEESAGFNRLEIQPKIPTRLNMASGFVTLPCGKMGVSFKRNCEHVTFDITLPEGKSAVFSFKGVTRELNESSVFTI